MCLALIAFGVHPRYRVVIAANRDEYHARPAAPAAWWDEGFLAGRDLKEGGTWLGIDRRGRFALLTNVRDPSRHDVTAPTRGALVPRFLVDRASPPVALASLVAGGGRHNGFNLVAGNGSELHWGSEPRVIPGRAGARRPRPFESPARHAVAQGRAHEGRAGALVPRRHRSRTTSRRSSRCFAIPSRRPTKRCRRRASPANGSGCCRRRSS